MAEIETIIFDLGGVLYDIDVNRTAQEFAKMGVENMQALHQSFTEGRIYEGLDSGKCNPSEFHEKIREISGVDLSDQQIDHAWNSLLVRFPEHRVKLLLGLREHYRIMLLSNTNAIHYEYYSARFLQDYGFAFDNLFDMAFLSYKLGMRKPEQSIYRYVIENGKLVPQQTVFIDDLYENTEAAKKSGLQAIQLDGFGDVSELFDGYRLREELI
jgi:putative hydrolase of the HAD superfamily